MTLVIRIQKNGIVDMRSEEGGMSYGIRVVLVMNRKGGSGKSTLCRALASAAASRGETVTIFDTDASKSCLKWMQAGQEAGMLIGAQ